MKHEKRLKYCKLKRIIQISMQGIDSNRSVSSGVKPEQIPTLNKRRTTTKKCLKQHVGQRNQTSLVNNFKHVNYYYLLGLLVTI